MAYEQTLRTVGVPASADLSVSQFCFTVVNANGQLALPAAGAVADGVLQDKPNGQGVIGELAILGITKLVAGAAVNAGDPLMANASGQAVTAAANNFVRARALAAATAAGIIIPALLIGPYKM